MSLSGALGETFGKRLSAYLTSPQDFRKYRERISRELLRLRHELGLVTRDTQHYLEKEKTSSISAENYAQNEKFGKVILLLAERSVIHSLEIKSTLEVKGQLNPGYKKLMVGKLKLAVLQCKKLVTVVENEADQLKKLEFFVYAALINGQYAINKKQWGDARHAFSLARLGLEFLGARIVEAQNETNSDESLFGKTTIDEILDTLVDPSLALAHSQDNFDSKASADLRTIARKHCHDDGLPYLQPLVDIITQLDSSFIAELAEEDVLKTVSWRSHEAAIYNDELALKLSHLNQEDWKLFKDANDYDSLYAKWSALVDLHQGDVDKSKDEDDMEKTQDLAILSTYLKYNMLFVRVKRDLLLIEHLHAQSSTNTSKLSNTYKDVLRLYASIIATTDELKDLPGVYNDEDLYESLEELCKLFIITRSAIVADSYAIADKFPEALKIYTHIQRTFSNIELRYKVDTFPYDVSSNEKVAKLKKELNAKAAKIHTLAQFQNESTPAIPLTVVESTRKFPSSVQSLQNITNFTKRGFISPVLSKPVLFDVAFNYIGYSLGGGGERTLHTTATDRKASATETEDKKKGGFFGIFGRG